MLYPPFRLIFPVGTVPLVFRQEEPPVIQVRLVYDPLVLMEGVVFNYRGHTFKLTGTFAALNRAINLRIDYAKRYNKENQA